MLRWLTAGESHGPALTAVLEGLPAGVRVDRSAVEGALARRRLGYGRGPRMRFEIDDVRILGGIYNSRSRQGAPKTGVLPVGGTSGLRGMHTGIGAREVVPEPTPSCHANVIVMR